MFIKFHKMHLKPLSVVSVARSTAVDATGPAISNIWRKELKQNF